MLKAAVAGANGYAGMTAVHLLARHPGVELVQLTSRSFAGKAYGEVFPLLDLKGEFQAEPDATGIDVVFSCLPHNVGAGKAAAWLAAGARVVDMSADFRLRDTSQYPTWYRQPHPEPGLLPKAVIGLPELHEKEIAGAELIAVPPSSANFVLARMPGRDLGPLAAGLRERGVLVRHFRAWPDALRISIGTPAEMAALFKALAPLAAAPMAARRNGRVRS